MLYQFLKFSSRFIRRIIIIIIIIIKIKIVSYFFFVSIDVGKMKK